LPLLEYCLCWNIAFARIPPSLEYRLRSNIAF
jgi:hypothetical protein